MPDEDGEKPVAPKPAPIGADAESESDEAKVAADLESSAGTPAGEASSDGASAEVPSAPKKKKKKKKKKRAVETSDESAEEKPTGPVLTEEGWERPGFVLDFPKDPELDRLVRAFELGNYAFVRENGKKLAESASDTAVRRAAGELVRRIEPDPLVKILFAMSVALFVFMVFYAYRSHGH
jgi:hypothetical protein